MPMTSFLPAAVAVLFIVFTILFSFTKGNTIKYSWLFPSALSLLFLIFSIITIIGEGQTGFWVEHTRNMWGNQIWFDLLFAVGIGWFLIVPEAKARKMRLIPWLFLIFATGCIGFTAMVARLLYLHEKSPV